MSGCPRKHHRSTITASLLLALVVVGLAPFCVHAQEEKLTKPIQIIVPFGPGGNVDVGCRLFADYLTKEVKVPVVVQNQAGGAGLIAAQAFVNNKNNDGYTMIAAPGAAIISTVQLAKTPPFDPRKALTPIGYLADAPVCFSAPKKTQFQTFDDLVKWAKANPGQLKIGVSSLGGETHIFLMGVIHDTKIQGKIIPYPATGGLVTAQLGGHLDCMSLTLPATMPYIRSGDMKALLLSRPSAEVPGAPGSAQKGLTNATINMWFGFFSVPTAPKGVVNTLVKAVETASRNPEFAKKMAEQGFTVNYKTPAGLTTFLNNEWDTYARIIKETGVTLD